MNAIPRTSRAVLAGGWADLHKAYFVGFVAVLLACWSPLKILAYALPTLFTGWLLLRAPSGISSNRLAGLLSFAVLVAFVHSLIVDEFLVFNFVLALITYSAFLPILVIDSKHLASRELVIQLRRVTSTMIVVQGVIGIIQAVYGATQTGTFGGGNGDHVQGTIYPFLGVEGGFANPMFATNMVLMLLACLSMPGVLSGPRRNYLVIGVVALVLASVVHVMAFLIAAGGLAWFITRSRKPPTKATKASQRRVVAVGVFAVVLGFAAIPQDFVNGCNIAEHAVNVDALEVPRAIMLYRVFTQLPEEAPLQPIIGLGFGQFSSRASLMSSGMFLGTEDARRSLPIGSPQATRLATDYCVALLIAFAESMQTMGSTHQPFFSFLSVYTELGLIGVLVLLLAIFRVLRRVQRKSREHPELRFPAFLFTTGTLFVVFLGFQENYWEIPQAILVGLLLLKVAYANIIHDPDAS